MLQQNLCRLALIGTMLMAVPLLLSCQNEPTKLGRQEQTQQSPDYGSQSDISAKIKKAICPGCSGSCRYFYKLALGDGVIIAYCDGCADIWLNPEKLTWEDTASDEDMEKAFSNTEFDKLFEETNGAGWATQIEVEQSNWKGNEQVLIKNRI